MPKRDTYHHGDLRQALIDAAVALIGESDVSSLSLRQVARRVGVSHAAPYRHFKDKEALLAVVAEEGFRNFTGYLKRAVAIAPNDPITQFMASGQAYLNFALEHPTHYRVMFGEFSTSKLTYEPLVQASDESFQVLVEIITDGQRQGLFRDGEARLMALAAWTQVHGLAMLVFSGRLGDGEDANGSISLAKSLGHLLLQGLAEPNVKQELLPPNPAPACSQPM